MNKVILSGNLTRDPQLSYLPSQTAVVEFGMAMSRKYKAQDGTIKEETCFVDCQLFGKRADALNKYFKKGMPILISGSLKYDQWEKDGKKQSKLRIFVESFEFMSRAEKKQETPQGEPQGEQDYAAYDPDKDDGVPF